jgi:hypothetical protein
MTMFRFGCRVVRRVLRGLLVLSLVAWLGASARTEPINQIVAFGDSLSDTGKE